MVAIETFYLKSNAPGLLKSVILRMIARLVVKIRYIYHQLYKAQAIPAEFEAKSHLERLFISSEFIQIVMDEAKTFMTAEEQCDIR